VSPYKHLSSNDICSALDKNPLKANATIIAYNKKRLAHAREFLPYTALQTDTCTLYNADRAMCGMPNMTFETV